MKENSSRNKIPTMYQQINKQAYKIKKIYEIVGLIFVFFTIKGTRRSKKKRVHYTYIGIKEEKRE